LYDSPPAKQTKPSKKKVLKVDKNSKKSPKEQPKTKLFASDSEGDEDEFLQNDEFSDDNGDNKLPPDSDNDSNDDGDNKSPPDSDDDSDNSEYSDVS